VLTEREHQEHQAQPEGQRDPVRGEPAGFRVDQRQHQPAQRRAEDELFPACRPEPAVAAHQHHLVAHHDEADCHNEQEIEVGGNVLEIAVCRRRIGGQAAGEENPRRQHEA
jgi:hypothetical protein